MDNENRLTLENYLMDYGFDAKELTDKAMSYKNMLQIKLKKREKKKNS